MYNSYTAIVAHRAEKINREKRGYYSSSSVISGRMNSKMHRALAFLHTLYSSAVRDMIDYSLRSCVERGVTVRRCKNCGRWFPQTGRVSAEYCERPVKYGEQRCREIGAFRQWTKKQTDDPIFKAYRKEYKKRFAWIKAGRVTDEQFYAWSEQAREEKKKCDREIISLEEFQQWLRDSKI